MEPQFVRFDDVSPFTLADGVTGRPLFGAGAMVNLIEFEPGATVPEHQHEHEQLGIVLRGMQLFKAVRKSGPTTAYAKPTHVSVPKWNCWREICGIETSASGAQPSASTTALIRYGEYFRMSGAIATV